MGALETLKSVGQLRAGYGMWYQRTQFARARV